MFPNPSHDTLTAFVYHTTRLERIPVFKSDLDKTLSGADIKPNLEGQFKAIKVVINLAPNPELLPLSPPRDHIQALQQLKFLRVLHLNQFKTVAEENVKLLDTTNLQPNDVGRWRQGPLFMASTEMPNPIKIQFLLFDWWSDLINFFNTYRSKIETPGTLEQDDLIKISKKAYETNLKLCCIKPFQDGSNRTARLVENLIRLNSGLPWKIIRHEDEFKFPYLEDIKKMQKLYPP
jgi:hypothetical protein